MREVLGVSERRACRTLGQHRSTQRKIPCGLPDEERLTEDIIALTRDYGRYGYRMIAGMLNNSGWHLNHKRAERIWRREGLKVPHKQKRKDRLWMNDGVAFQWRFNFTKLLWRMRSQLQKPQPTFLPWLQTPRSRGVSSILRTHKTSGHTDTAHPLGCLGLFST